jgi:hypothetical protein
MWVAADATAAAAVAAAAAALAPRTQVAGALIQQVLQVMLLTATVKWTSGNAV